MADTKSDEVVLPATTQQPEVDVRTRKSQVLAAYLDRGEQVKNMVRRRGGTREDGEDILQDVAVGMLSLKKPGPIEEPNAYLFVGARLRSVDLHRKRKSQADGIEELSASEPQQERSAEHICMINETLANVLAGLPPDQRRAMMLVRIQGLSYAEAAQEMNISPRQLETLLSNAGLSCERAKARELGDQT